MADKPPPPPQNSQEITITSIIKSIEELRDAIAQATTTVGEGGGSKIADEKEGSHHAIDDNATSTSGQGGDSSTVVQKESSQHKNEESFKGFNCNIFPKWVLSCPTGKKKHHGGDKSSGSSRGEVSPMDMVNRYVDQMNVALKKLQRDLTELQKKITRAKQNSTDAMKNLVAERRSGARSSFPSDVQKDEAKVLQDLVKEVRKLRHQIPTLHKSSFKDSGAHDRDSGSSIDGVRTNMEIYNLPSMQMSTSFQQSSVFTEIGEIYDGLETQNKKDCLLCFAVFPENEELKKKTLTYWWEGEGLLPEPNGEETIEKLAGDFLDDFVKKGLIEPICKKRRKKPRGYRMNPIIHGVVVKIAEKEKFFVYDGKGNPTATFPIKKNEPNYKRACLQQPEKNGKGKEKNESKDTKGERPDFTAEMKVETIFNFNEPFPDRGMESFATNKKADVAEWLSKMQNLKVLHLGRWQASIKHHIEVENTDFLKGLKKMGKLRLFSLQGVSRINKLTPSIKGLTNLKILDLKACLNLEVLPKEISYLKNLTHLDVSDCYLIDHMPKGLSYLTNLQVLEGFVVGDHLIQRTRKYCNLDELAGMKKLRRLSLNISMKNFPSKKELGALGRLTSLKKLTMSWGADLHTEKNTQESQESTNEAANEEAVKGIPGKKGLKKLPTIARPTNGEPQLPLGLEKLDLLRFPHVKSPTWLVPEKLKELVKLCIREGNLGELKKNQKWNSVKTLRLKFLREVKMSWEELQVEFPNLDCLEKVGCPRITFCPCDENGLWVKPNQSEDAEKPEQSKSESEQPKNPKQSEESREN